MGNSMKKNDKIDPNRIKVRDYNLVALINGAVKGGAFKDRRRENSRRACRGKIRGED